MTSKNDDISRERRKAAFMTAASIVACVAMAFFFFCFVESVVLLFTNGAFSFTLPALTTAFASLAFVFLALVGGSGVR